MAVVANPLAVVASLLAEVAIPFAAVPSPSAAVASPLASPLAAVADELGTAVIYSVLLLIILGVPILTNFLGAAAHHFSSFFCEA